MEITRHRRVLLFLIAALATLVTLAGPAGASTPVARPVVPRGGSVSGPVPQDYPPFADPAGDPCPFPLHGTFPVNHTVGYFYKNAAGRTVAAYYTGALTMQVTRVDTGTTMTYDISASGVQTFASDGSSTLYGFGPFSSTQHPGDRPGPELAILHGISALHIAADGTKTILYSSRVENVCRELA